MTETLPPEMKKQFQEAMELIKNSENIKIYSHTDCDGISSGAILSSILDRENKKYEIQIVNLDYLEDVEIEHELTIFSDLGSGQPVDKNANGDSKILILDHHPPLRDINYCETVDYDTYLEINPNFYDIDGSQEICGGGLCYLLAKEFGYNDLSWIGILAAIGDIQNGKTGRLEGLNRTILKDAEDEGLVKVIEDDISLYGRQTRPLVIALSYFSDVQIFSSDNNEAKNQAIGLLRELGIERQNPINGKAIRSCDLNQDDKESLIKRLGQMITLQVPKRYYKYVEQLIRGESYEFIKEEEYTFLRDASEFSTAMNACVRNERPEVALKLLELTIKRNEYLEFSNYEKLEYIEKNIMEVLEELENACESLKKLEDLKRILIGLHEKVGHMKNDRHMTAEKIDEMAIDRNTVLFKLEDIEMDMADAMERLQNVERGREIVLEELEDISKAHRSYLRESIEAIGNSDSIVEMDNLQYFDGTGIRSNVVGTIAGMTLGFGNWRKPIIAFAPVQEGSDSLKISLRCSKLLAYDGIHFGSIIREVAQSLGGNGGGHDVACGAYIHKDKKDEFLNLMNEKLEGKLVLD